jgi:uncharacterized protein (DUF58 family)
MTNDKIIDPELLSHIQALELKVREVADGVLLGLHHAPHRGRSLEFAEHREYYHGDDIKRIDWKLYAKSDKYYIKEYEDDTNITALMMVDGSGSMEYKGADSKDPNGNPAPKKSEVAKIIAGALSYLLLTQSDSVGLGIMDSGVSDFLPPRARLAHFHEITTKLVKMDPHEGTDMAKSLGDLAGMIKGRALVIIISDLLDDPETMFKAIRLLRHKRHEVVIFQVLDKDELEFPFERLSHFLDMEGPLRLLVDPRSIQKEYLKHFNAFLKRVRDECFGHSIDYQLVRTDEDPVKILSSWLSRRAAMIGGQRGGR